MTLDRIDPDGIEGDGRAEDRGRGPSRRPQPAKDEHQGRGERGLPDHEPDDVGGVIGEERQRRDDEGEDRRVDVGGPQGGVGEGMLEERGVERLPVPDGSARRQIGVDVLVV